MKKGTGLPDKGEQKSKGWSDNGHKAFEQWTVSIKHDVSMGRYILWEKAFREAQAKQREAREIEGEPVNKHVVNRSVVWEL